MVWAAICPNQRPVWIIIEPPKKKGEKKTVNAAVYRKEILDPFIKRLEDNNIPLQTQYFMQVLILIILMTSPDDVTLTFNARTGLPAILNLII